MKTQFAKTQLLNLAKGVFIASLLSLVVLSVLRLCFITNPKPTVSAVFFSFVCPKFFNIPLCQPTFDEIQLVTQLYQVHRVISNLPDMSCCHILFHLKSLLMQSWNDITSASLISLSGCFLHFFNFGKGPTKVWLYLLKLSWWCLAFHQMIIWLPRPNAWPMTIFNLSPTLNTCLFFYGNKASECDKLKLQLKPIPNQDHQLEWLADLE